MISSSALQAGETLGLLSVMSESDRRLTRSEVVHKLVRTLERGDRG